MVMEITYPAERVPIPEARAVLRPYVSAAYHAGMNLNEFYLEHVTKTSVTMRREDFFPWANSIYEHLDRAVSWQQRDPRDYFRITELAQERSVVPDRFWGRFEVTRVDSRGRASTAWVTYGFNDRMSAADLENEVYDYASEYYSVEGKTIRSVSLSELYKRY